MQHSDVSRSGAASTICQVVEHASDADTPVVLLCTDAALKATAHATGLPIQLLMHYDLPASKEQLARRVALLSSKTETMHVYILTSGQIEHFRRVETMLQPAVVEVMPVHAADLLNS